MRSSSPIPPADTTAREGVRAASSPSTWWNTRRPGLSQSSGLQAQPQLPQLLLDLVERGHAEVLRRHELHLGLVDEVADRLDLQALHAAPAADGEVQTLDRPVEDLGGHGRLEGVPARGE